MKEVEECLVNYCLCTIGSAKSVHYREKKGVFKMKAFTVTCVLRLNVHHFL